MEKMTLIEQAVKRQEYFKQDCDKYVDKKHCNYTIFCAIYEDNTMETSKSPTILDGAVECLMIHHWVELKITNWYPWFSLEYINEKGVVTRGVLENGYTINLCKGWNFFENMDIRLERYGEKIYESSYNTKTPFEEKMKYVWSVFCKCVLCETTEEAKLIGKIAKNEMEILDLKQQLTEKEYCEKIHKKEIEMYRNLLEELKSILDNYNH